MQSVPSDEALKKELSEAIVHQMGASYRPVLILLVRELPKTRNMKIMRRVLRSVYQNDNPGDLSSLVNPETVQEIREIFQKN